MKPGEGSELVQAYTVTKKASNPPLSAPEVLTSQRPFPEVGMDLEDSPTPLCHFPLSARTHLCQGGCTLRTVVLWAMLPPSRAGDPLFPEGKAPVCVLYSIIFVYKIVQRFNTCFLRVIRISPAQTVK